MDLSIFVCGMDFSIFVCGMDLSISVCGMDLSISVRGLDQWDLDDESSTRYDLHVNDYSPVPGYGLNRRINKSVYINKHGV